MCPICHSTILKIKKRVGLERVASFLTGQRKYLCRDCWHVFRAVDRRRIARMDEADQLAAPLAASAKYHAGK
jgi:hypothetical protein